MRAVYCITLRRLFGDNCVFDRFFGLLCLYLEEFYENCFSLLVSQIPNCSFAVKKGSLSACKKSPVNQGEQYAEYRN